MRTAGKEKEWRWKNQLGLKSGRKLGRAAPWPLGFNILTPDGDGSKEAILWQRAVHYGAGGSAAVCWPGDLAETKEALQHNLQELTSWKWRLEQMNSSRVWQKKVYDGNIKRASEEGPERDGQITLTNLTLLLWPAIILYIIMYLY